LLALAAACAAPGACSNNPYPGADDARKVRYGALPEPPKTLDPAVSYVTHEHAITANVYQTLLEYHYLKRPYELVPGLAREVPEARELPGGRVAYRFRLRPGALYADDPAFALAAPGEEGTACALPAREDGRASEARSGPELLWSSAQASEVLRGGEAPAQARATREVVAPDVAFELMRIADPAVASPVSATLAKIEGLRAFSERLASLREGEPGFAELRIDEQYRAAGGIAGVRVLGPHELEIVLSEPYPQLLYWFAMPFTAPVPWEAVACYDGQQGRDFFKDHPVASGPFFVAHYDKRRRIALERNPNWYGARHPEWRAPGAVYPSEGEPADAEAGRLDPAYVGRALPFLDRVELRIEKAEIPYFSKFLQGYYDASGIVRESFDKAVHEGSLSPEMAALGMRLEKGVDPSIFYLGFNMDDPVVGAAAGRRGRALRQAMSLAVDSVEYTRIFINGRGVPAQSPIPPGIFGYEAAYRNPYREPDLARAQRRLREAGYPGGIDPQTGKPLRLTFDLGDPSSRARLRALFFVNAWKQLGLDMEIAATDLNQFRDKVHRGAYQIFTWGWIADYPDPENFLFLLWGPMSESRSGGPNTANFTNARYDRFFVEMKNRPNDARRLELIRKMRAMLERERPWIELYHNESYTLYHGWLRNVKPAGLSLPTAKYVDLDPVERARLRREWNRPIVWPAWALGGALVALTVPGVVTFLRERQ
jgi:ABC-type transport system substrate-binding protein